MAKKLIDRVRVCGIRYATVCSAKVVLQSRISYRRSLVGEGAKSSALPTPNTRGDLVGKTCVVDAVFIKRTDQYKVTMEFTN